MTVGGWTYDQKVMSSTLARVTHYQLVIILGWVRTGKLSRYITNTKVNSSFHPSVVGKVN